MITDLAQIRKAAAAIADKVPPTPSIRSPWLSSVLGAEAFLKLESFHPTGSFKVRGACYTMGTLSEDERRRGVIAMSAGNHAQAVAYFARELGIVATIVMPEFTPFTKVQRTKNLGAEIIIKGENLSDSGVHARELAAEHGFTLIHPYDDQRIITGQGTAGLELLEALPDLDAIVVPVGGGGLISGIAVAAKALKPSVRIYGVQSALFPTMKQALAGEPITCGGATLAEGIAVKAPGQLTREIIRELVDDIFLVDEATIENAVFRLMTEQKIVSEGAGAAGVAALLSQPDRFKGQRIATVICGGNIDARLMASTLMRGLVRDSRLVRLRIDIVDVPGALARISEVVAKTGGNIVEVHHQRLLHKVTVKQAELDMVIETRDRAHVQEILEALLAAKFTAELMTEVE